MADSDKKKKTSKKVTKKTGSAKKKPLKATKKGEAKNKVTATKKAIVKKSAKGKVRAEKPKAEKPKVEKSVQTPQGTAHEAKKVVTETKKTKKLTQPDPLYAYAANFLKVGTLILVTRIVTVLGLSYLWGFEWNVRYWYNVIPVVSFSEQNVPLFATMNTVSLLATTTVLFLLFLAGYFKKLPDLHKFKLQLFGYYWNVLYLGLFITLIQFLVVLALVESIHFAINWFGVIPIFVMLLLATVCYLNKKQQVKDLLS